MTEGTEQEILNSKFGIVSNKRVTYYAKKGWFSGGSREDVPLNKVVSVRHDTDRHIFTGLFLIVLGLLLIAIIIGIIPLIIGIVLLLGYPKITVTTAGGTSNFEFGFPWDKDEAKQFVDTLNTQLFSE